MIAVLEAHRAGLFARIHWLPNLIAGLVVGIVALPLAMDFAIASGARPEQGIYTAIIGGGLISILGGTRVQTAGPTGAFIVILAGITAKYGVVGLQVATLMAGLILVLMGLARMSGVIKFIPAPVVVGFTAGIGVIIFVSQWSEFFGLPAFEVPTFSVPQMINLIGPAFTIAMLGSIEALLSAVVADGMSGTKHDSNQELIGQGVANMVAPFFGGFAATGAIARTATNIRNGATSPLAGITLALTLIAVLLFLAPLASGIPLAVLAAILFIVAWNMSEAKHFAHLLKTAPLADRIILVITFVLTVFADLVVAVNVGMILAILHFLRRMSDAVETLPVDETEFHTELARHGIHQLPKGLLVYEIAGPMFFSAVENFERALVQTQMEPVSLIIRLRRVPFMDVTGIQVLEEVMHKLRQRGIRVILCEANERVLTKLQRARVIDGTSPDDYADRLVEAVRQMDMNI